MLTLSDRHKTFIYFTCSSVSAGNCSDKESYDHNDYFVVNVFIFPLPLLSWCVGGGA